MWAGEGRGPPFSCPGRSLVETRWGVRAVGSEELSGGRLGEHQTQIEILFTRDETSGNSKSPHSPFLSACSPGGPASARTFWGRDSQEGPQAGLPVLLSRSWSLWSRFSHRRLLFRVQKGSSTIFSFLVTTCFQLKARRACSVRRWGQRCKGGSGSGSS